MFTKSKTRWFKHQNSDIQEETWFCGLQKICVYVLVFVLYSNIPVMSQEIWGFILIPSDLEDPVSLITEDRYEQCCNPFKNTEIIIISFPVTWPIQTNQIIPSKFWNRSFLQREKVWYIFKNLVSWISCISLPATQPWIQLIKVFFGIGQIKIRIWCHTIGHGFQRQNVLISYTFRNIG